MTTTAHITRMDPALLPHSDRIRIFINDCSVDLFIGVYSIEMQAPQPILINLELEAVLPHHYHDVSEKKLDRVIDYEPIYNFIQSDLPKMGHLYLLETAAEQILDFCFKDIRVQKARVRLEKTTIFPRAGGAGIEITRSRSVSL